jgi:hypothetical protein
VGEYVASRSAPPQQVPGIPDLIKAGYRRSFVAALLDPAPCIADLLAILFVDSIVKGVLGVSMKGIVRALGDRDVQATIERSST